MAQQAEQGATPEPSAQMEPSATDGQAHELTVIVPLKPGGAERTRQVLKQGPSDEARARRDAIGTLHDMRVVFFDNDTRMLFATVFDGTWDNYIDDFGTKMPDQLDALFAEAEGYPGIRDPKIKDYIRKVQIKADMFYCAYPMPPSGKSRRGSACSKPGKSCWTPLRSDIRECWRTAATEGMEVAASETHRSCLMDD